MTSLRPRDFVSEEDVRDAWPVLTPSDRVDAFRLLKQEQASEFFLSLSAMGQTSILRGLANGERRLYLRSLDPDDIADVIQEMEPEEREPLLGMLDDRTRREVTALLAYAEDDAGGLMSPRFARVRAEMTVDEAIAYLRKQARDSVETIYYAYVLDAQQRPLGVASFRQLFRARGDSPVRDVMVSPLITVAESEDQETVARLMTRHDLMAIPVVDDEGRMKGIVTVDDIVDVVHEEATEDMQKAGGMEALDLPYLQTRLPTMVRKRAVWLAVLFLGEMLTATAMGHFEGEISRAVVLALFLPLIISSGGNSGSQATTLVIRAMALGEVKLRDWFRVVRRELASGIALGAILAAIGFIRVIVWQSIFHSYGAHGALIAVTVAGALFGVVIWGTLMGAMLPFVLRRAGFDPASASAPFVATLVDVSGLVIYFSIAKVVLAGTLL